MSISVTFLLREFSLGSRICLTGIFFDSLRVWSLTKHYRTHPGADGGVSSAGLLDSTVIGLGLVIAGAMMLSALVGMAAKEYRKLFLFAVFNSVFGGG